MQYDDEKDPGTAALAAVAGLARSVEALSRDVAAMKTGLQQTASKTAVARLNDTVASLGNTVASFEDLLTRLAATPGARKAAGSSDSSEVEPVRSWLRLPELDEAAVEAVLSELLPWMEITYLRYATGRETLPPCWLWHPEIVEELVWLMDAWTAAYEGEEASNKLVGDWTASAPASPAASASTPRPATCSRTATTPDSTRSRCRWRPTPTRS